ncbi:hypothetical protein Aperf_G00000098355 [Anoplocephala perfoliata]
MLLDDDPQPLHAMALATFNGSSSRELSFQRGAELLLYRRLNEHWWEGQLATSGGPDAPRYLVPNLYIKPLPIPALIRGVPVSNPTITANVNDTVVANTTSTGGTTTDESTSGVDDDAPPNTASNTEASSASHPKKPPRRYSITSEKSDVSATEPAVHVISIANDSSAVDAVTSSNASVGHSIVTTSKEPSKDPTLVGASKTSDRSRSVSPRDNSQAESSATTKAKEVQPSLPSPTREVEARDSTSSSSILSRSANNPSPTAVSSTSPLRRSGNRGSWVGTISSSTSNAIGAPTASLAHGLETLPEDKLANIKSSQKPTGEVTDENIKPSPQSNGSLHDVDSALAEIMRGLACLERGRSQGAEANSAAEQRSRELEQKMRLPSAVKPTSETLFLGLQERPKPPNFSKPSPSAERQDDSPTSSTSKDAADTFAEQAGGTVRKRVSATFNVETKPKPLPTSASLSIDLSCSGAETKSSAVASATATRWPTRKLASEKEEPESIMSKSFVMEGRSGEKENLTSNSTSAGNNNSATDSPVPIKRGSIAARVAAFEASNASAPAIRPSWVRKT